MNLSKKILLASLFGVIFTSASLYASSIDNYSLTTQQQNSIKSITVNNLDSLFEYPTKITIGQIQKDSNNFVVSNILIKSDSKENPSFTINKLVIKGLNINEKVNGSFTIKIEGLHIDNLAPFVANSNLVSAKTDSQKLLHNQDFNILTRTLGQAVYNFEINYDYRSGTISYKLNSTIDNKPLLKAVAQLNDINLSDIYFNADFLATLFGASLNANIISLDINASLSEVLKNIATKYLGNNYKNTAILNADLHLEKKTGEFNLNIDSKLDAKNYANYNIVVDGINLDGSTVSDVINGSGHFLDNAYIKSSNAKSQVDINLSQNVLPNISKVKRVFATLGKSNINFTMVLNHRFNNSNYNTNFYIKSDGLASLSANINSVVKGRLNLLSYLGTNTKEDSLYDCYNKLCLNSVDIKFNNQGFLEKIARHLNRDPNTTPQQILASYGALLQLIAVQQQDRFLQHMLSSFAIFLQNPQNISIHAQAKKPVNENALLSMLFDDAKELKKYKPIQRNGNINLNQNFNVKLINNIQNIFKLNFEVNK